MAKICPVSSLGKNPLGIFSNKTAVAASNTADTASVARWCRSTALSVRS